MTVINTTSGAQPDMSIQRTGRFAPPHQEETVAEQWMDYEIFEEVDKF